MEPVHRNHRPRVGLALGGGVARGMAHVGVLSVLEEADIPIDYIAGTSAGSLVGLTYSAGMSVAEIRAITRNLQWWHLLRLTWPRWGFFNFNGMAKWLRRLLGDLTFADLHIPYTAVATDMDTGEPVRLNTGRVAPAVQASCSVPGVIEPVVLDGRMLADGSLSDTVPVDVLRDMGAEYVIGVDIFTATIRPRWGPFGMGFTAGEILIQRAGGGINDADCLISPDLGGKTYIRFSQRDQFFKLGEDAARLKLPEIRKALGLESEPAASR